MPESTQVNLFWAQVSQVVHGKPLGSSSSDGQTFVLLNDYYSRYPEAVTVRSTTAGNVIVVLKSMLARRGILETVWSDNGSPFSSRVFSAFPKSCGFTHITSSPNFLQSRWEVELMVCTIENFFRKAKDTYLALLSYRDTPSVAGSIPAQLLMGTSSGLSCRRGTNSCSVLVRHKTK